MVNGDPNLLDVKWDVGLIRRVMLKLEAEGIREFPSPSFIDKAEYQYFLRRGEVDTL